MDLRYDNNLEALWRDATARRTQPHDPAEPLRAALREVLHALEHAVTELAGETTGAHLRRVNGLWVRALKDQARLRRVVFNLSDEPC